ncbi:MAG: hypothetical protein A2268_12670 [Candidatus Raymondbacteria bacterium RifOxyA12_full_50_37]|uniref:HepT-like domain-containing protein n=1 Tax=Candidatus Raymondbacteria bacterium RIFOXYD12_FULL_49_13 TaxID=1817890 RepID=A0A1F7FBI3_UNCRA|nr:MAG: hypothetical protein A2268_12670 [Candidatus Raymondbacteria bacterium RifOxyA12_full_50_37]OGJ91029.1 MAG: hypothetical protein A2248_00690 [Candidatus Raymondbacteria bacterium RIFOXYA2_FULL_49_16]OGJ97466.1 MAG: hypothetical protein A2453_10240 [Candidatus Raymondbacteria bacterium RIFOXYC2_FULL_50_21]OGJ97788.1 MAG: hypothetical protein A2487_13225 [Candidatus Raymondbacteria bacterium RifOxyC12_full_50_8]OGJ99730.1 MAG: hypothetical protein A2350_08945 [Candidatus Raymondbacteria b
MKRDKLEAEIRFELGQLEELASAAKELSATVTHERRSWDPAAAAKYIADVAAGLENLCKRRYVYLEINPPAGPDSHNQILNDFFSTEGLGKALSEDIALRIKKYLRFRHRFIHGYGHKIQWELVEEPLRLIPDTVAILKKVWQEWLLNLSAN